MVTEVRVPKLGMTQTDITVVELKKKDGDQVAELDLAAILETSKARFEIAAPCPGKIFYVKKVKDKVKIGDLLGVVSESREEFEQYMQQQQLEAEQAGDVAQDAVEEEQALEGTVPPGMEGLGIKERVAFIGMRRTIADNLVSSLQTGAQLTIVSEIDLTELAAMRENLAQKQPDNKITFVDMLVKIVAHALKDFPIVNSTLVGDEIICWNAFNIGVAMALDDGLVVPVVRDADKKSLFDVSRQIKEFSRKARTNELDPVHYQGGTFTLSSGGKVETDFVTPIINPPQSAIMAIGKIAPRPAVHNGELTIRTTAYLCVTHDHRIVDGIPASLFLGRVKEIIEQPELFAKIIG